MYLSRKTLQVTFVVYYVCLILMILSNFLVLGIFVNGVFTKNMVGIIAWAFALAPILTAVVLLLWQIRCERQLLAGGGNSYAIEVKSMRNRQLVDETIARLQNNADVGWGCANGCLLLFLNAINCLTVMLCTRDVFGTMP